MKTSRLRQLHKLAKAGKAVEIAEVLRRRRIEDAIRARAAELGAERTEALRADLSEYTSGEAGAWSRWIDGAAGRITALDGAGDVAAREAMAAEKTALDALGRERAVEMLIRMGGREARARAEKHANQQLEELGLARYVANRAKEMP